jgi:HlyD family secretion protein
VKRVLIFAIVLVVLIAVLVVYLNMSRREESSKLVLSGVVEATESDLSFRIPGKIVSINYDKSDLIDSGAVVATLDDSDLMVVVKQTQDAYEAGKANIKQLEVSLGTIERNLGKLKELVPSGAATQAQLDDLTDSKRQAEAQLQYARKNLQVLEANIEMAKIKLSYTELLSPLTGTVLDRMYEPGEVIQVGSPVLTMANLDDLKIKVYVPELYLGKVKLGQEVSIYIDSQPDKPFKGKIKRIYDKAEFTPKNIQTRAERVKEVFALEIGSSSHSGMLKPGLPCDVDIPLNQ